LIEWLDHEAKLDLTLWDFSHLKIFRDHRQFFVEKPSQAACNRKSVGRQK